MPNIKLEYDKRDILSKYALTKIEAIHSVLESFKDKKMFKVNGDKTKAFKEALEPLKLAGQQRKYTRDYYNYYMQSITIRPSYSTLEIHFRCLIQRSTDSSNTYFDIKLNMARFKSNGLGYDYNDVSEFKTLEQLETALISFHDVNVEAIEDRVEEIADLEAEIKRIKDTIPYWSYR